MNNRKRVLFIGAINENNLPLGGEEYKNQLILTKLKAEKVSLFYIDTFNWKKSFTIITILFWKLLFSSFDSIFISASSVSTYRLLFVLSIIKPSVLSKITYAVIGGYLPEAIEKGIFKVKVYKVLHSIIVEGNLLKSKLCKFIEADRIKVIPNFKEFPSLEYVSTNKSNSIKFVYLGRISDSKGVSEIIRASKEIKTLRPELSFIIDFYGPLEEDFAFEDPCNYIGYLDFINEPEKSYAQLNKYDCMLFPTFWKGEGFPGVIVDAFIAGLPVIATHWNMNVEIIQDGINGFIIPPNDINRLTEKMLWVVDNIHAMNIIRENNLEQAKEYHIDKVWPELFKHVL